jgi:hypothetical protein
MRAAVNAPQVVWVAVSGMDARQWIRPPPPRRREESTAVLARLMPF